MPNSNYPKHTIGKHIVKWGLTFNKKDKASEVIEKIRKNPTSWPNIENIIVVDSENKLLGTVEFREILAAPPSITLENLATENSPYVSVHSHQSSVAKIALKQGVENIPVVDEENHFVGIVDATQILKILHEEHVEKLMHFSGILNNEYLLEGYKSRITQVVSSRLPWLLLGLLGGALSTFLIRSYSQTLEAEIALAFFIPVIVYMNSAVGTQAQIIFVRNSSLEKVHLMKSLVFEVKVCLLVGLSLSLMTLLFTSVVVNQYVGLTVAISMFLGILSSAFIGTVIPYLLMKFGKDPAIGSGPFTTIIQDLISIIIYFSVASIIFSI